MKLHAADKETTLPNFGVVLGLMFTPINWNHDWKLVNRLNKSICTIKSLKNIIGSHFLKQLYYAKLHSNLVNIQTFLSGIFLRSTRFVNRRRP